MKKQISFREELEKLAVKGRKQFSEKIILTKNPVLGLRAADIRALTKKLIKEGRQNEVLGKKPSCYEENIIYGLLLSNPARGAKQIAAALKTYAPLVDNWASCDVFCSSLKVNAEDKPALWTALQPYLKDKREFYARLGFVMLLCHFVEEAYLLRIFAACDAARSKDYYAHMALAWLISVCFVKYPKETFAYLQADKLGNKTHNKALSKIRESFRVSAADKERVLLLRRKGAQDEA